MNKNYMIYPLKTMRITARYDENSHKNHNTEVTDNNIDYPIDDGGFDTGKDAIYCPCDEMKVTAIRGLDNSSVTNTIWLVSTTKVTTPTFTDIVYMTLTHSNDDDIRNIKVGNSYKRGDIICYEGNDGSVNNHIHITCGRGFSDNWSKNSNGSLVIVGDSKRPEEVFFVDRDFTNEIWGGYIPWVTLPKEIEVNTSVGEPVTRDKTKDQLEVIVDNLNARKTPSLTGKKIGFIKRGLYDILDTIKSEGYVWKKIEDFWIATSNDWVVFYQKEGNTNNCQEELSILKQNMPKLIYTSKKSGKYIIYLEEGKNLYLS